MAVPFRVCLDPCAKQTRFLFLTGASGAGKTCIARALEAAFSPDHVQVAYFDQIGIPTPEDMIGQFGSPERWQEATTYEWVKKLAANARARCVVLEGQFNPTFAVSACRFFGIDHFAIAVVHADDVVRERRLIEQRGQPELANQDMRKWASFLRKGVEELGGLVIDTTHSEMPFNVQQIIDLISAIVPGAP